MKLTEELETLVSERAAMWDPESSMLPELQLRVDGELVVVVIDGVDNGFKDVGDMLVPFTEQVRQDGKTVTEYALIFTGRFRHPETGEAGEWAAVVLRGNADGQEFTVGKDIADISGRVPEALAALVAA